MFSLRHRPWMRLTPVVMLSVVLACASNPPATDRGAGVTSASPPAPESDTKRADGATKKATDLGSEVEDGSLAATNTVDAPDPDPNSPPAGNQVPTHSAAKGALRRHAESGLQGLIMGTVLGGQIFGQYGAAVGGVVVGLYGLVTGDVPFDTGRGGASTGRGNGENADAAMDQELDQELDRQKALEDDIETELHRQEKLLSSIDKQEAVNETIRKDQAEKAMAAQPQDPLAAPVPPVARKIPESIFDTKERKAGRTKELVKTLDADRNGTPEIEMVFDAESGGLLSRSEDTDYDGTLDTHNRYENGEIVERTEDTNHDGQPDRWIRYEHGRGTRVDIDRDFDGSPDAHYLYAAGTLKTEENDTNGDGRIDHRVEYEDRQRNVESEDRDHDGRMDFFTYFDPQGIPARTEQDSDHDGKTDVWETYEGTDPAKLVLVRKEEDLNQDGKIDVTSYYEKGKLKRKEVSDPSVLP